MTESEALLVQAARDGRPGAFERLALPIVDSLFSVIAGIAGRVEAEDLLQETLLSAYRCITDFRGECSFRTWISRIAVNAARTFVRKKKPVNADPADDPAADPFDAMPSMAKDPVEELTMKEDREMVEDALRKLPPEEREVLVMREVDGLSYDDIAASLQVTQAAVRSRLHRARNRMFGMLGGRVM